MRSIKNNCRQNYSKAFLVKLWSRPRDPRRVRSCPTKSVLIATRNTFVTSPSGSLFGQQHVWHVNYATVSWFKPKMKVRAFGASKIRRGIRTIWNVGQMTEQFLLDSSLPNKREEPLMAGSMNGDLEEQLVLNHLFKSIAFLYGVGIFVAIILPPPSSNPLKCAVDCE